MPDTEKLFTNILLQWHKNHNKRQMPWKGVKEPYKIWLSEVILQQTRVDQGLAYYERFLEAFPTVSDLADADDAFVFKLWEGLGYYNRCRNLLATARIIRDVYKGVFPNTYEEILALKGIGPYTAAAIASFAYNLPYAVVDGNVYRVLARYFGIATAIDSTQGKTQFAEIAARVLNKNEPALYNQAIMDFGATVCKPVNPSCTTCHLNEYCIALKKNLENQLPVKEKKLNKKTRFFNYFIFEYQNEWLIQQRTGNDIWNQLFEFYLIEDAFSVLWSQQSIAECLQKHVQLQPKEYRIVQIAAPLQQQLTHQKIVANFIQIELKKIPESLNHMNRISIKEINQWAFPKIINEYLQQQTHQPQLF